MPQSCCSVRLPVGLQSPSNPADDAVQATKARIEALKKESTVPESPSKDSIPAKPPQARPRPQVAAPESKGPKKLSDVKVNANIAASLGGLKLSSPAAGSGGSSAGRGAAAGATAVPAIQGGATAAPSHMDLLGGLDAPAPTNAQHSSGQHCSELPIWVHMHRNDIKKLYMHVLPVHLLAYVMTGSG